MRRDRDQNRPKKWMVLLVLSVAVSISACSFLGSEEKNAGEPKRVSLTPQEEREQGQEEQDNKIADTEAHEQGRINVFSNMMTLKLPQGLEVQSKETSESKLSILIATRKLGSRCDMIQSKG